MQDEIGEMFDDDETRMIRVRADPIWSVGEFEIVTQLNVFLLQFEVWIVLDNVWEGGGEERGGDGAKALDVARVEEAVSEIGWKSLVQVDHGQTCLKGKER